MFALHGLVSEITSRRPTHPGSVNVDVCSVGINSHGLLKAGFGFLHLILTSKYPRLLQQGVHIHLREGEGRESGEGGERGEGREGGRVGRGNGEGGEWGGRVGREGEWRGGVGREGRERGGRVGREGEWRGRVGREREGKEGEGKEGERGGRGSGEIGEGGKGGGVGRNDIQQGKDNSLLTQYNYDVRGVGESSHIYPPPS